ncbi:MAG: lipid-A-disaccharide synthase [Alphaproteobacteria bacterium]|nr:lipid-A-disaccharide synthase [Alphaproteobacteria bacterium]NCQ88064.1 lipid-A-disaccharide synthase [Alphaproteobacteria bacterium]NCT05429.1 lipid-A-disaccharide synthase [Alphaproteobacteria bacterium]
MKQHIYLIAGEASGDFLGAQLMAALKEQSPDLHFSGVGGTLMTAQGLNSLFPMDELSVMGVFEILPKLKSLLGRIEQTAQDIIRQKPDIVITIDAPDFSFRVHKKLRKALGLDAPKLVHYVAPTVWAWRPKRAAKISKFLDALICLFHFEPPYFEKEGLEAIAVGHPMMESGVLEAKAQAEKNGSQKLGVFFGSRRGEVKRLSPILIEALRNVKKAEPAIELVVPTLAHIKEDVEAALSRVDLKAHIFVSPQNKWEIFKSCDAAIAVSGTVGLELSACNVPHLIAYRMNSLTAFVGRMLIKTRFAHLANIILNKEVVPEFIQENCTPEKIARQTLHLLNDEQVRVAQQNAFNDVRTKIMGHNQQQPSKTAADFILLQLK